MANTCVGTIITARIKPQAVKNGACTGSVAHGWAPVGAMQFTLSLAPGASQTLLLGRGMGFRDSCQDLLGFVHMIPQWARERILDIAATQFPDGSAYHQYQPLTKKGNLAVGSGFNDDPLWLIAGTDAYLRETGDRTILDEPTFGEGKNSWLTGTAGRSPASRRPFSACSPRWRVLLSPPAFPRDGQAIPSSAATAVQSTASLWRILTT